MVNTKELRASLREKAISPDDASTDEQGRTPKASSLKLQATSFKQQASSVGASVKRRGKRQATSVECGPNRQAPSMAFRDDLTADRGSLHSHKVLCVHDRRPGLR